MRTALALLVLIATTATGLAAETKSDSTEAGAAALAFINSYVKATYGPDWDSIKWVNQSPLVTENFKRAIAKLITDGWKKDPEVGLDADPVIDGNDCPASFTVKSAKATGDTAAVVLVGPKDYPAEVKVRLVRSQGQWLVDASGMMLR